VLIADEPTDGARRDGAGEILHLIDDSAQYGMGGDPHHLDLGVVRRFADHVHVMQHGEVREEGPTETVFAAPRHAYTRRLLASDPKGEADPAQVRPEPVLEAEGVRVAFTLRRGGAFRRTYHPLVAVDGLSIALRRGETLGLVGESGSGKTTFGQALLRSSGPTRAPSPSRGRE
jgi:peptide/nickel transport system ATP-binding protein